MMAVASHPILENRESTPVGGGGGGGGGEAYDGTFPCC